MKFLKLAIALFLFLFPTISSAQIFYDIKGNTIETRKESPESYDVKTDYTFKDISGEEFYPIYIHKYVRGNNAGRYTCYVYKTSINTGKIYKYYLPSGMKLADDIISKNKEIAEKVRKIPSQNTFDK